MEAQQVKKAKYRVLKDLTDREGAEHKTGDIVELAFDEAQAYVNSNKLTADLGDTEGGTVQK
jgi:hypothetical protein